MGRSESMGSGGIYMKDETDGNPILHFGSPDRDATVPDDNNPPPTKNKTFQVILEIKAPTLLYATNVLVDFEERTNGITIVELRKKK